MSHRIVARTVAAAVLSVPLGAVGAGTPAQAADCPGPSTHPDRYSYGHVSFGDGVPIKTGPYAKCTTVGLGYSSHGIDAHCYTVNSAGNIWWYVRNTTTGKNGWVYDGNLSTRVLDGRC